MRYNLSHFLHEPIGSQWNLEIDEDVAVDAGSRPRVRGEALLTLLNNGVWVEADLTTIAERNCDRCLESYRQSASARFSELFGYGDDGDADTASEQTIDADGILNLYEVFRQNYIISLPVKSVCEPACEGLCAECGRRANACGCHGLGGDVDPRWLGLTTLSARR